MTVTEGLTREAPKPGCVSVGLLDSENTGNKRWEGASLQQLELWGLDAWNSSPRTPPEREITHHCLPSPSYIGWKSQSHGFLKWLGRPSWTVFAFRARTWGPEEASWPRAKTLSKGQSCLSGTALCEVHVSRDWLMSHPPTHPHTPTQGRWIWLGGHNLGPLTGPSAWKGSS